MEMKVITIYARSVEKGSLPKYYIQELTQDNGTGQVLFISSDLYFPLFDSDPTHT